MIPDTAPEPIAVPVKDHRKHVSDFAVARMTTASGARVSLNKLHVAYKDWCEAEGLKPLPTPKMAELFAALFEHTETPVDVVDGEVFALGVDVKPTSDSRELVLA